LLSLSGGILCELLVEMWFDANDVYKWVSGGLEPFLLPDGHELCLSEVFVYYITDPAHIWHVNLGVPHATATGNLVIHLSRKVFLSVCLVLQKWNL
jgi:hypothetical protein